MHIIKQCVATAYINPIQLSTRIQITGGGGGDGDGAPCRRHFMLNI